MIIIAGHLIVGSDRRDDFVAAMQDLVRRAERRRDNWSWRSPLDPRRVQNLEVWQDADALDRWRDRSDAPELDIEVLEDHVLRYDATDGGPMFP